MYCFGIACFAKKHKRRRQKPTIEIKKEGYLFDYEKPIYTANYEAGGANDKIHRARSDQHEDVDSDPDLFRVKAKKLRSAGTGDKVPLPKLKSLPNSISVSQKNASSIIKEPTPTKDLMYGNEAGVKELYEEI